MSIIYYIYEQTYENSNYQLLIHYKLYIYMKTFKQTMHKESIHSKINRRISNKIPYIYNYTYK